MARSASVGDIVSGVAAGLAGVVACYACYKTYVIGGVRTRMLVVLKQEEEKGAKFVKRQSKETKQKLDAGAKAVAALAAGENMQECVDHIVHSDEEAAHEKQTKQSHVQSMYKKMDKDGLCLPLTEMEKELVNRCFEHFDIDKNKEMHKDEMKDFVEEFVDVMERTSNGLKKSDQRKIKERGSMRTVKTVLAEADGPLVQTLMDFVITPAADTDGDGMVSPKEFLAMMRYLKAVLCCTASTGCPIRPGEAGQLCTNETWLKMVATTLQKVQENRKQEEELETPRKKGSRATVDTSALFDGNAEDDDSSESDDDYSSDDG